MRYLIVALTIGVGASPAAAQVRVATLDDLRRELSPGDMVSVVQTAGDPVRGRLLRFGDADLAKTAVESRTGLVGHLAEGFGEDGLWWEGENYHLFALRGLMQGIQWARSAGYDLLEDPEVRRHFRDALLAPARTALPDFTYPARRDSRYGVSLAESPSVELWEIGRGWLGGDVELDAWLAALYARATVATGVLLYDAWLHDAGRQPSEPHGRGGLSWWALTAMPPAPDPGTVPPWNPASLFMNGQGLAVLRHGDLYASLECGRDIGGHGHPDRLHLTLHAGGVHWLPDPGTGSYVEPVLEWYRSALAHNAPRLDGMNVGGEDAWCSAFEASGTRPESRCRPAAARCGAAGASGRARGARPSRPAGCGPGAEAGRGGSSAP